MIRIFLPLALIAAFSGCRTNESPEGQVKDLQITAQVKSKLASDVGLSSVTNISVNTTNGVVTLSGQVKSEETKAKVLAVTKSVPEVTRVVDSLQVITKSLDKPRSPRRPSGTPLAGRSQAHPTMRWMVS